MTLPEIFVFVLGGFCLLGVVLIKCILLCALFNWISKQV